MDWLDGRSPAPGGGNAASGGSFYHVSFRSGSRASGASARSAHNYITREAEYGEGDRDPAIHTESDHMPAWAEGRPGDYWEAADLYERANGRLFLSADFALPREMSTEDQVAIAHAFAQELTAAESLPYTLAVHAGLDASRREHNPHAHLMVSERKNDGIERSREQWFRRANSKEPGRGGAPKSRSFHGREWVEHARGRWAELTNAALERAGRDDRVDHRSYERQGIDREGGQHYGPSAAHMVSRGDSHDRLESAARSVDQDERLRSIEGEIAGLEAARAALVAHIEAHPELVRGSAGSGSSGRGRDDDSSPGR